MLISDSDKNILTHIFSDLFEGNNLYGEGKRIIIDFLTSNARGFD